MKKKKTSSILRKFLLFNLSIFSVLGLFTILYLNAIQPNLVKKVWVFEMPISRSNLIDTKFTD